MSQKKRRIQKEAAGKRVNGIDGEGKEKGRRLREREREGKITAEAESTVGGRKGRLHGGRQKAKGGERERDGG